MKDEVPRYFKIATGSLILFYLSYYIFVEIKLSKIESKLVINTTEIPICEKELYYFKFDKETAENPPKQFLENVERRFLERLKLVQNECTKIYKKTRSQLIQVN
jgi:hypothetical protein